MSATTILESIFIRFYLGDEKDEMIARHLGQFNNGPRGAKHDEIKRLIHIGLQVVQGERKTLDREAVRHVVREALGETQSALIEQITDIRTRSAPDLDAADSDVVRRVVQEAMRDTIEEIGIQERVQERAQEHAQSFGLSDIRRVINAALQQYLDHLVLGENASGGSQNDVDDDGDEDDEAERIEELLSNFDRVLIKK